MAQRPPQRNRRIARTTSPAPEYYIDLTVDSPVNVRTRLPLRRQNRRTQNSNGAVTSQNVPPPAEEADPVALNRASPRDVIYFNDSMSGEANPVSCPVCFEFLTSSCKPTTTRCGHLYCADCLEQTLARLKKCPTCQLPITQKSCIRLYI